MLNSQIQWPSTASAGEEVLLLAGAWRS
jgi:hypothetical protein